MADLNIVIAGAAGQGLQSAAGILAKAILHLGFEVYVTQDYQSRIRGGHNFMRIRFSDRPIGAAVRRVDFLLALNEESLHIHLPDLAQDGQALCMEEDKGDVSDLRLNDLCESFEAEARAKGIDFICLNPMEKEAYEAGMAPFKEQGFDDIIVLAPVPPVISDAATYLAPKGVMNVFAGVARGTKVSLDLSEVYLKDVRSIGHSASTIDDLRLMLSQAESGELSPNRAVAAIGSLNAAKDGLQAVRDATFPGKVVIFPHIKDFPLTSLPELKDKLPSVYAKLKNGREWTVEAEREFLELMLPE